jgi:hypothetical protein
MINNSNVFINCPFDNNYFPLLKPLIFTILYLELNPKISETTDSGEARLSKIKKLMAESKYSIHDLSRMEPLKKNDYPRFNMPFECGIDFGLRMSDNECYADKNFLILEKEKYRYKEVISDISGNDIKAHNNEPEQLIKAVRDWFKLSIKDIPSYKEIWLSYNEFEFDYEEILREDDYNPKDIYALTFLDIIEYMTTWIVVFKHKSNAI